MTTETATPEAETIEFFDPDATAAPEAESPAAEDPSLEHEKKPELKDNLSIAKELSLTEKIATNAGWRPDGKKTAEEYLAFNNGEAVRNNEMVSMLANEVKQLKDKLSQREKNEIKEQARQYAEDGETDKAVALVEKAFAESEKKQDAPPSPITPQDNALILSFNQRFPGAAQNAQVSAAFDNLVLNQGKSVPEALKAIENAITNKPRPQAPTQTPPAGDKLSATPSTVRVAKGTYEAMTPEGKQVLDANIAAISESYGEATAKAQKSALLKSFAKGKDASKYFKKGGY